MSADKGSLLGQWLSNQEGNSDDVQAIKNTLSFGEERLYFLQSLDPTNPFYHYAELFTLTGDWDISLISESIDLVVSQYSIFSENYIETENGELIISKPERAISTGTIVGNEMAETFLKYSPTYIEELKLNFARGPFSLDKGPLFRYLLIENEDDIELLFVLHHIITDKWSMQNFREKWKSVYQALKNGNKIEIEENSTYREFATKQRQVKINEESLSYWGNKLKGESPDLVIPYQNQRTGQSTYSGKNYTVNISKELAATITTYTKENNATIFATLLTAFKILLSRYSGKESVSVGTPVSTRDSTKLESMIGFFNETITIKSEINSDASFSALSQQVSEEILRSVEHKQVPYQEIVNLTNSGGIENPFFSAMFLFHQKEKDWTFGDDRVLQVTTYDLEIAKFDFTLYIEQNDDQQLKLIVEYSTDLYDEFAVKTVVDDYLNLVDELLRNPKQAISKIRLKKPELDNCESYKHIQPNGDTLVHQILAVAAEHPNAIAVSAKGVHLTYAELESKSRRLANQLSIAQSNGIVGLFLDRSVDFIVGILGVLRAGLTYLPIDPEYPIARVDYMLNDSDCALIVTSSILVERLNDKKKTVLIDQLAVNEEQVNFAKPDERAYRIYTSGSSGNPKGVTITHKNLWYSNKARDLFYDESPSSFLLLSSFSFDSSIAGIFWTLSCGGKLVISEEKEEQNMDQLIHKIYTEQVSHVLLLPSLYDYVLEYGKESDLNSLKTVIVAGEACKKQVVEHHFDKLSHTKLVNEYGPTEATVWSIAHRIQKEDVLEESIPIGRPIPFIKAQILDEDQKPVPKGIPGELYLSGPLIANGYHNRERETEANFIAGECNSYKTGDLVVLMPNGNLKFLGRVDDQVKIRGHRVELDEISSAIKKIDTVKSAEVIYDEEKAKLYAYYSAPFVLDGTEISGTIGKQLPNYMIPTSYTYLNKLPTLPNGKIDRNALRQITTNNEASKYLVEPINETEKQLLVIWREVLEREDIGVLDNFFSIGGDSLISIRVNSKARSKGFDFSTNQIFIHQTIRELSDFMLSSTKTIKATEQFDKVNFTPIQEWFFETHTVAPQQWNQIYDIRFKKEVDFNQLEQAIKHVINQHQSLRARFDLDLQQQHFDKAYSFNLDSIDAQLVAEKTRQISENFDIEKGNLFRAFTYENGNQTTLRIISHHLIFDVVSLQNFVDQMTEALHSIQAQEKIKNSQKDNYPSYVVQLNKVRVELETETQFWEQQIDSSPIQPTTEDEIVTKEIFLSIEESNQLKRATSTFNTTVDELLLTTYLKTIGEYFDRSSITVGLENHGRAPKHIDLNLSQSIGWFTNFYPRSFSTNGKDIKQLIKYVKEQYRQTPNAGIGFSPTNKEQYKTTYPYLFNYLGNLQQSNNDLLDSVQFISQFSRHPDSEVYHKLELNITQNEGLFFLNFRFNVHYFDSFNGFLNKFKNDLEQVIETCLQSDEETTVSDYDVDGLVQDDLDELTKNFEL